VVTSTRRSSQPTDVSKAIAFFSGAEMPARVWSRKYRLRDKADNFLEESPLQTFCRMADAVEAPTDSSLRSNLVERRFIPAGRILFALGNPYFSATLKNCYVLGLKDDSLEAISDLRGQMARTYAMGGGVGIDLSTLRPAGAPVKNCAITSSGAASFADGFSHLTGEIGQNGRRGALMISLSVDHPDIERFVHAKNDFDHDLATRIREKLPRKLYKQLNEEVIEPRRACGNANMSVRITDRFMKAVKEGKHHITRFITDNGQEITEVFDAKKLFRDFVMGAWSHGCPGCLFWDTMAREDNRNYLDSRWHIVTTNPCGEQPLSDGGSCNLGAVNLARFTTHPYTDRAEFDWAGFKQAVRDGVRFLDEINTIELKENRAPISKQAEVTEGLRQIGLGVMGYGDLLLQHQIKYGSDDAIQFTDKLFRCLRDTAYHESIMLAKEKGPFPAYDWEKIKRSPFIDRLPAELKKLMKQFGLRNSNVLSIAPTGTIAIMGETTGGVEPEFAFQLTRAAQLGTGKRTKFTYLTPTAQRIAKALGKSIPQGEIEGAVDMSWLPEWAIASHQVDPLRRAKVQGVIQKYIDTAISSTVNLPETATVEDVMDVYWAAYEAGCKGITVYREGSREGILQTLQEEERLEYPIEPPLQINSRRISFKGEHGLQRILINMGDYRPGVPCEVSVIHGKSGTEVASYASALGIALSIALQNGVHPIKLARAMEGINAGWAARLPLDGKGNKPTTVQSVPDAVAAALRKFYGEGIYEKGLAGLPINGETNKSGWELTAEERNRARICPKCQKQTYIPDSSCWKCINPGCDVQGICG
jgi:ribonucleoside-diphosphate reductase alpha chain